jgi:hypothetical protein
MQKLGSLLVSATTLLSIGFQEPSRSLIPLRKILRIHFYRENGSYLLTLRRCSNRVGWGSVTDEEMKQYEIDLRRWGHAGIHILLSDQQLRTLAERARGWPWNGYELIQMRKAGKYPPQRLAPRTTRLVELRKELAVSTSDPKFP